MSVEAKIILRFRPDRKLVTMTNRLGQMTPEAIAKAVQFAMRRTLLEGIKQRYAARGMTMQFVERAGTNNRAKFNAIAKRQKLVRIARLIAREQENSERTGRRARLNELMEQQRLALQEFTLGARPQLKSTDKKPTRVRKALDRATARKKKAMDEVIREFAGAQPFRTELTRKQVTVGVGVVARLNDIRTPSATEILKGTPSPSPYHRLWLQMEFGAGLYAKPSPVQTGTKYKTAVGSWWYGPKAGKGIHFIGQHPGNLLRDRTGLPYSDEYRSFIRMFGERMSQLIFGE